MEEAAEAVKASGLTFGGDIGKTNPRWYVNEFERAINMGAQPQSHKKTLFKSTLRGAVAQ